MAFTVEDFHDLIELLAQHPEWRTELRRHVLSDDLIELPSLVRQLVEAQTRAEARLERVEARLEGVETRLDRVEVTLQALAEAQARAETRLDRVEVTLQALAEAQARAETRLDRVEVTLQALAEAQARAETRLDRVEVTLQALAEAQARAETRLDRVEVTLQALAEAQTRAETRLDRVEVTLQALAEAQTQTQRALNDLIVRHDRLEDRVGGIDGRTLEIEFQHKGPAYLGPIARRLRNVGFGPLGDLLDDAVDDGRLTVEERHAVMRADAVLSGRRRDDGQDVYLLVEISAGIGVHDVERAIDRATLLGKVGRPVLPVVAGLRIHDDAASLARTHGVWAAIEGQVTPPLSA